MTHASRITFVVTELGPGGAETQVFRVSSELQRRGYAVQIISLKSPVGYSEELRHRGVRVDSLDLKRSDDYLDALQECARVMKSFGPRVVVNMLFHANVLGSLAAVYTGVERAFTSVRGVDSKTWRYGVEHVLLRSQLSGGIITNSPYLAGRIAEMGVSRLERIKVIPNGIDMLSLRPTMERAKIRKSLGVKDTDFLWLCVANVLRVKDFPTLLSAFRKTLDAREKSLKLVVAGAMWDHALRAELEGLMKELKLETAVSFVGGRDDIPNLLGAADGFVLTSLTEGTPNAIIEAMAAGVPVVATRAGGVQDLICHQETGLLADVGDSAGISECMSRVMGASLSENNRLTASAKEFVQKRHDLQSVVDHWERVLVQ